MVGPSLAVALVLAAAPTGGRGLAIVGATLVDAEGAIEDGIVVVSEGRVEAVGPRAHVPLAKGLELQDGRGLFVVPGAPWSMASVAGLAAGREATLGALRARDARWRAGRPADLVVLDKDPLADPRNLRAVVRVLRGGRRLEASEAREAER